MSMEKKRPQLNLAELYQLKWLIGGALALLSAWTVLYMEVDAWLWLVLITVATPVVVRWPTLTLRIPRIVHRLAFPLFVTLFAADYYFKGEPLPAMIRLALMLVFYRVITPRKRRDDLQLIILGLFLVVVAGVLSVSLAFAVQIVIFTGCALVFLLVITLIDSAEMGQPVVAFSAASPPAWMKMEWTRLSRRLLDATDWRVTAMVLGLFGGVVGLSALLFFALPRFELSNTFFLDNMISRKPKTGFTETVRFGEVTEIQNDTSVALRVEVSDVRAIPLDPYWRMLVLDLYENGGFSRSTELENQLRVQRQKTARVSGTARPRLNDPVWTFYLEGSTSRFLPLLGSFFFTQFSDGPQGYAVDDENRILRLEKTPSKMFAYRVEGMRYEPEMGDPQSKPARNPIPRNEEQQFDGGRLSSPQSQAAKPTFLNIGLSDADKATLAKLVKTINAPTSDPKEFATYVSGWLGRQHQYSLSSALPPGSGDPLVRWIGSDQPGHCELFAGAFTLLARSAGYPTRLITGYRGGSWNAGNYLSIRNSDAHAWCEIYDQAKDAWIRVDPTPGSSSSPDAAASQESSAASLERIRDNSMSAKLDGLRMFWYRRIVDFDQAAQVELARDAKNALENYAKQLKKNINDRLEAIGRWLQEPWDLLRLGSWAASIVLGVGIVVGWKYYGRGLVLRWRSGLTRTGVDPVRREAGRWLRRIQEVETARVVEAGVATGTASNANKAAAANATTAATAVNAATSGTAASAATATSADEEWRQVRADLERLRYGPRKSWPNSQSAFRRAKRAVKRA